MNKKVLALMLATMMMLSILSGCAATDSGANASPSPVVDATPEVTPEAVEPTTKVFTDSTGREVELPAKIEKVAVSGPLAQIVLFALAPDMLVGIATEWDATAEQYFDFERLRAIFFSLKF